MLSTQLSPIALRFGRSTTSVSNSSASNTNKAQNTAATTTLKTDTLSIPKQNSFWESPCVEISDLHSELSALTPVTQGGNIMRHLFVQQMLHPNTRVQFHLNNILETNLVFDFFPALSLLEKPVDVISKSMTSKAGLCALTHPNVRSFMTPESFIIFESDKDKGSRSHRRNTEIQIDRWRENIAHENLATQVLNKIGKYDRKELITLFKAREGMKTLSSLEALHLGEKGLVDGILVGNQDQVVTRKDLDDFLKNKKEKEGWTKKQVEHFLQDAFRINEIPSQPLKRVFPDSLPIKTNPTITKPELFTRQIYSKKFSYGETQNEKAFELPTQCQIVDSHYHPSSALILKNIQNGQSSILNNHAVFFTDEVDRNSIGNCITALKRLDHFNQSSGSTKHIPLILNSGGGSVASSKVYMDALKFLKTPVDVIITSVAASAALTFLTLAATGKRFASPNALLMLHETSLLGSHADTGDFAKQSLESIQRYIAQKTGRPVTEIRKDILNDYWLNPLEGLFYGDKGLIDGILVGPRHVITRKEVMEYLKEKLGSEDAANKKIKERLERRRDMHKELDHDFDPNDPFDNVLKTFEEVTKRKTRILGDDPDFKHSGPNLNAKIIEHIPIKPFKSALR
jgi:ATP-dependent Clp protease protease subunit